MKQWALCGVIIASAAAPAGEPEQDDRGSTVQVVGLHVVKPLPGDHRKQSLTDRRTGTILTIQVTRADKHFLGVDGKASRLESFTDDHDTPLIDEDAKLLGAWADGTAWVSPDGTQCLFEVLSTRLPARGARRLKLEAKMVLKCGRQGEVAEQPELRLEKDGELTAGPAPMKVTGVQRGDKTTIFTLSTEKSIELLARIEFLDAGGRQIDTKLLDKSVVDFMGTTYHDQTFCLETKKPMRIDAVRARVHYFRKVEKLTVPVKVAVGLGL
jgi:hypothetical protein